LDIEIDFRELLIPGTHMGDKDDTCYAGIFNHGRKETNENGPMSTIIFGNIIMNKYYIVYDASTLDDGKLYVGIA
jgi:hypothetical protein